MRVSHLAARSVRVLALRLPGGGAEALEKPSEAVNSEYTLSGHDLRLRLPQFGDGDAYLLSVAVAE